MMLSDIWRLSDICLSDVCRVYPVGGRRVRPAGWMAHIGWSGTARPAWLKAVAARFRCRPRRGHIVAAARLQLVVVCFTYAHSSLLWLTYLWTDNGCSWTFTYVVTLRASCGAVYCNRSCLFVCGWVGVCVCLCVWVCYYDNSKLRAFTKLGL